MRIKGVMYQAVAPADDGAFPRNGRFILSGPRLYGQWGDGTYYPSEIGMRVFNKAVANGQIIKVEEQAAVRDEADGPRTILEPGDVVAAVSAPTAVEEDMVDSAHGRPHTARPACVVPPLSPLTVIGKKPKPMPVVGKPVRPLTMAERWKMRKHV